MSGGRKLGVDQYCCATCGMFMKEPCEHWRAINSTGRAEAALRAETPREPKLTISDLDEILGGYDSADVTRGTVLQRLNEWLRIRAAGEPEQAK